MGGPESVEIDDSHLEHDTTSRTMQNETKVDTLQGDEAAKVLAAYAGSESWGTGEERKVVRKIDRKLMCILFVSYGIQYWDKSMLSQAAIFGLRTDLDLEVSSRYSLSASIFYLGFIAGAYPATLMAQRWPVERVAAGIVVCWGVCLMSTAACKNWQGLYAQRFFLGFLESGVSPMFMMLVGSWYKKDEQALRMGVWYSASGFSAIISPLINYGLGHIKGSLSPWRYMYLVAGLVTVIWAVVLYFYLPPDPVRAKGFTDRERYIAVARLRSNNAGVRNTHFKKYQLFEALTDTRFWLMFVSAMLCVIANGPVSTFIPIIIHSFGFSTLNSLLLIMPAGAIAGIIQILAPLAAFKIPRARTYIFVVCELLVICASLLLLLLPRGAKAGLLIGAYFLSFFGAGFAVQMGIQIANTAGYTKRSITSSGIFVGYCLGNFIGPLIFRTQDAPTYKPGFIAVIAASGVACALVLLYRFICIRENTERDKTGTVEAYDNAYEDDLTDKTNPQFRYVV